MKSFNRDNLSRKTNMFVLILFLLSLFLTVILFIAPLTLEPGTVTDLDGAANQVVYAEKWEELPLFHRAVYYLGDLNCHQRYYRSYIINDNQMPVDARVTGNFIGLSFGFLLMTFAQGYEDFKRTILALLGFRDEISEKKKWGILICLGAIFTLPLVLDGSIQLITTYESFNLLRTFTGTLFGSGLSVFFSSLIISVPE